MIELKIDTKGFQKFALNFPKEYNRAIKGALLDSATTVHREATKKGNIPWLTGNLAGSFTIQVDNDKAVIGTNVIYAPIHEFGGTIRAKNRPFLVFEIDGQLIRTKSVQIPAFKGVGYLRPALFNNQEKIVKMFSDWIEKAIKKI